MLNTDQSTTNRETFKITLDKLSQCAPETLLTDFPERAVSLSVHSASDINEARRAMTLGVKLAHRTSLNAEESLPFSFTALSCGLHLSEIGVSSRAICLGFLSKALTNLPLEVIENHISIIERKFPNLVPAIIALADLQNETTVVELARKRDIIFSDEDLFVSESVQRVLTSIERLSCTSGNSDYEKIAANTSLSCFEYIVANLHSALELAWKAYANVDRKRGPELQPMFRHAVDVALLVSMSGAEQELVVAGLLHDIFEGYKTVDGQEISRGFYTSVVEERFGRRVREVIETLTEPPKSELEGNWEKRKTAVLEQIKGEDADVATVLTASKISTFSDGTLTLWRGLPIEKWSSGSHAQNVWVMERYIEFAIENKVSPDLVLLLQLEATRFKFYRNVQTANLVSTVE